MLNNAIYPVELADQIEREIKKLDWSDVENTDICLPCWKILNDPSIHGHLHPQCRKRFFYEAYERDQPKFDIL